MLSILRQRKVRRNQVTRQRCLCLCACGIKFFTWLTDIQSGNTQSCGCLRNKRLKKKAQFYSSPYSSPTHPLKWLHCRWAQMWARCANHKNYAGRGIRVCERWNTFETFLEDMGVPEDRRLSIDRINNDGNYEPGNCRWATAKEQQANKRPRLPTEKQLAKLARKQDREARREAKQAVAREQQVTRSLAPSVRYNLPSDWLDRCS